MLTVLADEVAPTLDNALSREPLRGAEDRLTFLWSWPARSSRNSRWETSWRR